MERDILKTDPCDECGIGFTQIEWDERCSEGLPDVHKDCCRTCNGTALTAGEKAS